MPHPVLNSDGTPRLRRHLLRVPNLFGMAKYLRQWMDQPKEKAMAPADLVGLLVDSEWVYRENRRLELRLQNAKFKQQACIEDIDYAHPRGLGAWPLRWGSRCMPTLQ